MTCFWPGQVEYESCNGTTYYNYPYAETPPAEIHYEPWKGTEFDGDFAGGAACFHSGEEAHYYHGIRGEWEDDDF